MRKPKLNEKYLCIKEYDDETFMEGRRGVNNYYDHKSEIMTLPRPDGEPYGTDGEQCEIIDVLVPSMSELENSYSMYFPKLNLSDVFLLSDLEFDEYFVLLCPHVKLWRNLND
jgi:hypothetical protein